MGAISPRQLPYIVFSRCAARIILSPSKGEIGLDEKLYLSAAKRMLGVGISEDTSGLEEGKRNDSPRYAHPFRPALRCHSPRANSLLCFLFLFRIFFSLSFCAHCPTLFSYNELKPINHSLHSSHTSTMNNTNHSTLRLPSYRSSYLHRFHPYPRVRSRRFEDYDEVGTTHFPTTNNTNTCLTDIAGIHCFFQQRDVDRLVAYTHCR